MSKKKPNFGSLLDDDIPASPKAKTDKPTEQQPEKQTRKKQSRGEVKAAIPEKPKKVTRKIKAYYLSTDTIELIDRMVYWDRHKSSGLLLEKLVAEASKGKVYDPIPKNE